MIKERLGHLAAVAVGAWLSSLPSYAAAQWKVHEGRKALSTFPPLVGMIATANAKKPSQGTTAELRLECFTHPQLSGLFFGVVTSKPTAPGFMGLRFQYDQGRAIERPPSTRWSLTATSLGDRSTEELKGLLQASRMRLTLLPPHSPPLVFDFDVAGAETAGAALACQEFKKY